MVYSHPTWCCGRVSYGSALSAYMLCLMHHIKFGVMVSSSRKCICHRDHCSNVWILIIPRKLRKSDRSYLWSLEECRFQ